MDIGIFSGVTGRGFDALVADAGDAAERGFHTYWLSQIVQQTDAMTMIGAAARRVDGIRFGTSVVPTYPRHPMVMAEQAMTTSLLADGRFTLGIGLSHRPVVEGMWGMSFDKPVRHAREYLDALMPLVGGAAARAVGETITARGELEIDAPEPPVVLAALGPQMLRLAGERCAGTITWMTGAATLAALTVPTISEAASDADRPPPGIFAGMPIWVTDDVDAARDAAARTFAIYGELPSYRAMLDREGLDGPADLAVIGDEDTCAGRLDELEAAGATHLVASEFATDAEGRRRTRSFLAGRL
ncbi:TIGR03564 family F420-dependent LLM class oxidoreductase [Ilumatobacter sp.]|uniref:TIGR03564 family F420-dependent LLM class oxidoreductase n=1 Tax=Ilumatobacter sp. TaxID=1967498 RepID=UPI003B521960